MAIYSQEFKVQSVEKALSRSEEKTLNNIADDLHIGYSTLQRWISLAKKNKLESPETNMSTEKSPLKMPSLAQLIEEKPHGSFVPP